MPARWLESRSWRLGGVYWLLGTLVFVGLGPPIAFFVTLAVGYIFPDSLLGHFVSQAFFAGTATFSRITIRLYLFGVPTAALTGMVMMAASAFLRWQFLYILSLFVGFLGNAVIAQLMSIFSHPRFIHFDFLVFTRTLDFDLVASLSAMVCVWLAHPLWLRMEAGKQVQNMQKQYAVFAGLMLLLVVAYIAFFAHPVTRPPMV